MCPIESADRLIQQHTHAQKHTYMYALCSVVVLFAGFRRSCFSASIHGDPSPLNVCNTHTPRCSSPVSSVVGPGFLLEVHLTLLQDGFQLVWAEDGARPLIYTALRIQALEGSGRCSQRQPLSHVYNFFICSII